MRIGVSGRVGAGIVLFAVVADAATWLVRAIDNYPFGFYELSDAYLPVVFIFGLALLLPSLSVAIQTKRAANLAKFPLTTVGPVPPALLGVGQVDSHSGAMREGSIAAGEFPPPLLAFVPSPSHRKLLLRLGCSCLLLAALLYVSVDWWMGTLTFVPSGIPIAIDHGHIRTADFRTDFRAVYFIDLTLPYSDDPRCVFRSRPWPPIPWKLLKSGRPLTQGTLTSPYWYYDQAVGRVEVPKGAYSLVIDLPEGCALGTALPKVAIEADRRAVRIENIAAWLFYILAGWGIALILWPEVRETEELSLQAEPRGTYRGMAQADRRLQPLIALTKPLSSLRMCSYMAVMVLLIVWWFHALGSPLPHRGLMVYVPKPGTYLLPADKPWSEALVVRVDAHRSLYLNRQPVPIAELGSRLELALSIRADRTVFIDGDPDDAAGDVIVVADLALGAGATKIVLVTPSMEKEKPELALKSPCEDKAPHAPILKLPPKWRDHGIYPLPLVSFIVEENGKVSNIKIQTQGDIPELTDGLVSSARKLKYASVPGCGKHELYLGYGW